MGVQFYAFISRSFVKVVSFAAVAFFSLLAQGATKVWTGGSGDWSDSANWLDGNIPVAGDTVYVSNMVSGVTINIDTEGVSLSSIRFEGVGTVTLAGEALTLTGTWSFMNYKTVENGNMKNYHTSTIPFLAYGSDVNCRVPLVFAPGNATQSGICTATNTVHFYEQVSIQGDNKVLYIHDGLSPNDDDKAAGITANVNGFLYFHAPVVGESAVIQPQQAYTWQAHFYDSLQVKSLNAYGWTGEKIYLYSSSNKLQNIDVDYSNTIIAGAPGVFPSNAVIRLQNTRYNPDGGINLGNFDATIDRLDGTDAGNNIYAKETRTDGGKIFSTANQDQTGIPRPVTLTMKATADGTTALVVHSDVSLVWDPEVDYTLTFTNRTSATTGNITVKGGKVKFAGNAAFPNVRFVDVYDNADFEIASSAATPLSQSAFIRLGAEAKLVLADGVNITVGAISVDGECVADGVTYNSTENWIEGNGTVTVAGSSVCVWKTATSGSWSDADNWFGGVPDGAKSAFVCNDSTEDFTVSISSAISSFPANFFMFNRGGGRTTLFCAANVSASASSIFVGEGGRIKVPTGVVFKHETIDPSAYKALSNDAKRDVPGCRVAIADGGEWLVSGGETVFTNFYGTFTVKGINDAPGRFDMRGGTFLFMDIESFWPLAIDPGGIVDLRDGEFKLPHHGYNHNTDINLAGGVLSLSNTVMTTQGKFITSNGGSILFGTGETVLDGMSVFSLQGGNSFLAPEHAGQTARITVKDQANINFDAQSWVLGGCQDGKSVFDFEGKTDVGSSGGTFLVGDLAGESELNVKSGILKVNAYGLTVALGAAERMPAGVRPYSMPVTAGAVGRVTVASGAKMQIVGSLLSGRNANTQISGIAVGYGIGATSGRPFDGRMEVEGVVVNDGGNTMIGFGRAVGTYVQNGGSTTLTQWPNGESVPILSVGAWSGDGRLVVSNGVFTSARGRVFVGGCPQSEVPVFDASEWTPQGAPENGHDAEGVITVVDGFFVAASNVVVGADGAGAIEMVGSTGSFTARDLVLSNATSSVVRFIADANGFSPVTVQNVLTVTDGASVEVDLSGYSGEFSSAKVFNVGTVEGRLADVKVKVTSGGSKMPGRYYLLRSASGIDVARLAGTFILFR